MTQRQRYTLVYARGVTTHLKAIDAKYDSWGRGGRVMKTASVGEIKSQFSSFLKASEAGPVVVTRNGKPVAVIVGVQDEGELERLLMAYSPRLRAIVEASRKQIRKGDVLGHEEFWKEVEASRAPTRRNGKRKAH
jgi:prevent-host-death family protein